MCNKIKCAIQYTVDLINNNIIRNVQTGCTGYIHIAVIRMMENNDISRYNIFQFIKLRLVNVMRLSLCLGASSGKKKLLLSLSVFASFTVHNSIFDQTTHFLYFFSQTERQVENMFCGNLQHTTQLLWNWLRWTHSWLSLMGGAHNECYLFPSHCRLNYPSPCSHNHM